MSIERVRAFEDHEAYSVFQMESGTPSHSGVLSYDSREVYAWVRLDKHEFYHVPAPVTDADSAAESYVTVHADDTVAGLEDIIAMHNAITERETLPYKPKTPLGQRLCKIRERIVASGTPLLEWEDIECEIADSRAPYDEVGYEANLR